MLPHARRRGKRLRRDEQSNKTQINDRVLFKVKQALQRSERSAGFIPGLHCECDTYWPCDLGRTSLSNQNLLIHESRSGALNTRWRCLPCRVLGFACVWEWYLWMGSCASMQAFCVKKDVCGSQRLALGVFLNHTTVYIDTGSVCHRAPELTKVLLV